MHSSSEDEKKTIAVILKMASGETLFGKFLVRKTIQSLADALNKPEPFIEFETNEGEQMHLAKSGLASIKLLEVAKVGQLDKALKDSDRFNPYQILQVTPETPLSEIRGSYLALARRYHPDIYATIDLPKEVRGYIEGMLSRINTAYQMVTKGADITSNTEPNSDEAAA